MTGISSHCAVLKKVYTHRLAHLREVHKLGGQLLRLLLQLSMAGRLGADGLLQLFYLLAQPLVALLLGPELRRAALLLVQRLQDTTGT